MLTGYPNINKVVFSAKADYMKAAKLLNEYSYEEYLKAA